VVRQTWFRIEGNTTSIVWTLQYHYSSLFKSDTKLHPLRIHIYFLGVETAQRTSRIYSYATMVSDCSESVSISAQQRYLPFGYQLNDHDVFCGRGTSCFKHVGNRHFRSSDQFYPQHTVYMYCIIDF
jgi:hypothetical protein